MSDDNRPPRYRTQPAKTPVRGVSLWTDDQRAQVGAEHRRQDRARISAAIEVPRAQLPEAAEPIQADSLEMTSPSDLVTRDRALMEIWEHIEHVFSRVDVARRQTADHVLELQASHGGVAIEKLRGDVDALKRVVRWLIGLLIAALTAAGGSLITVGREIYDRGAHEGGDAVRLEHVERATDRLRDDMRDIIDRLGRHSSLLPSESSDLNASSLTASKGTAP